MKRMGVDFHLFLCLLIAGCSTYPKYRTGIVHDYIISQAITACRDHQGFHYLAENSTIFGEDGRNHYYEGMFPCKIRFRVSCQDGSKHEISDQVAYCFISEMQWQETWKESR